jgi:hypothetical protein
MALAGVRFSGQYLASLKERFDKHLRSPEVGNYITGPALALVDQWAFKDNAAGVVNVPVMENGKPVMTDPQVMGHTESVPKGLFSNSWVSTYSAWNPIGYINDYLWPDGGGDEVKSQSVPLTKVDEIVKARVTADRNKIADLLKMEIEAQPPRVRNQDEATNFVAAQAIKLGWNLPKSDGSRAKEGTGGGTAPAPPSRAEAERRVNEIIERNRNLIKH